MSIKNQVQLITYADSLGGSLKSLEMVLNGYFMDIFKGGIHILPPFPSSGDRGFAPLTYFEIEPSFGTWDDIKKIGEKYDIAVDLMVNHISQKSEYFQDFLKKGKKSQYADYFLTLDKIWPDGNPVQSDIDTIYLRRKVPYSEFKIIDTGETIKVWTTFGKSTPSEQIDLDVNAKETKDFLTKILKNFACNGVKIVRLDAIGFVVKKPGTSCFFVEPEIYAFMNWLKTTADSLGIEILPEVHANYAIKYSMAERGFWIYDFILPYMVLDTMFFKRNTELYRYLKNRPEYQFTTLDCHDGIPVMPDLEGLINEDDAAAIVKKCLARGARITRVISEAYKGKNGFDVHQIVGTFYSIMGCDDDAYIASRAIQFFVPGIPQVYYAGMLAGENDILAADRTGEDREINRHNFTVEEIGTAMEKTVVKRLMKLIRFRNDVGVFNGEFAVIDCLVNQIQLKWTRDEDYCVLHIDLVDYKSVIYYRENGKEEELIL